MNIRDRKFGIDKEQVNRVIYLIEEGKK